MGVKKLWDLLEPCGRRISIEALTGKRLAVDASGLLFHRIKPVFVFDGATPAIKRMTVIARRRQREQQDARLRRTAEKLLLNQLKQHALAQVASQGGSDVLAQMAGTQKSRGKRPDPFQEVVAQGSDAAAGGRAAGAQPHAVPAQCVPEGPALGASAPLPGEVEQELEAHLDLDLDQLGGVESGEIDAEVLSQLPPSVQLEVMLKLREAQVVANREKFAAAQGAPLAFSQVQMAQYLKATAFRRQVNEIKEAVNAAAGLLGASRRIAGEPGREYVLLRDEEALDGPGVPGAQGASSPPEPSAAPASSAAPPSSGGPLPAQDPLVLTFGASDLDPATDASEEEVGWEDVEEEPSLPGMLASPEGTTEPVPDVGLREQRDLHWRERAARRQRFWSLAQGFRQGRALSDWGKAGDGAQGSPALSPGRAEDGTRDEEEQALQAAIEASLQESREAWEVAGNSGPSGSGPARGGRESGWVGTLPPETALPPLAPDCQASFAGASETNQASHAPASGSEEDWEDVATEPAPPGLAPSRVAAGVNTASETELNRLLSGARASAPDKPGQGLAVGLSVETVAPPHVGVEAILTEAGPTGGVEIQALDSPSGPQVSPEKKAMETNTAGIVEGGKALNAVAADPLQPDAGELPADAPQASAMNHVLAAAPLLQEAVLAAAQAPLVEDSAPSPAAAAEAADVTEFLGDMEPEAEEEEPLTFVDDFGPGIGPGEAEAGLEALRHEALGLRQAQRAQRGQADAPTDEMYTEIQDMLQMFGVPYIVAPGEAEAQCAWLDAAGLVDGVITDDDDAFLFGAQTVYRHIFSTKQTVEEYRTRDVESELGLSRPEFISLALLLGSDYTPGVRGIGIVNATEVVHAFQGMEGLQDFRAWVQAPDAAVSELIAKATDEATQSMRRAFQLRHRGVRRNWDLPSDFPSPAVLEAYLSPRLDTSRDRFLFGRPDLALLRSLCTARLEWTPVQADELLLPVLKAWDEREHQQTLEPFLAFRKRFAKIQSKRLQHAVRGIAGKTTAELELAGSPSAEAGTARKPRAARSRAKTAKRAQSAVPAAQAGQGDALSSVRLLVNQVVTSTDTKSAGAASSQLIQLLSSPASQHGSLDAVLLDLQPLLGPGNGNPSSTLLDAHSGLGAACAACLVQRIRDSPAPDQALGSLLRALPRPAAASLLRGLGLGSRAVNTSWGEAEWRAAAALAARGAAALDREEAGEATRAVSAVQEAVARLPIWPASDRLSVEDAKQRLALLRFLLSSELERLAVWESPLDTKAHAAVACDWPTVAQWETLAAAAWIASPRLALALKDRFPGFPALRLELERFVLVNAAAKSLQLLPQAGALLAEMARGARGRRQAGAPAELGAAAPAASTGCRQFRGKPEVLEYLSRSLHECNPEEVAFFLPQLVQMLRTDHDGVVARFLLDAAAVSVHFAVVLACQLRSEGTPPDEAFDPQVRRSGWSAPKDSGLWQVADKLRTRLMSGLPEDVANLLKDELAYFDDITEVSGKLYPVHKDKRKSAAVEFLKAVELPRGDLFLPTNPDCTVLAHIPESAAPMQSAAKCPILVAFKVHVRQDVHPGFADGEVEEAGSQGSGKEDEEPETRACIFKVGDDCRQDILALQVIGLLKKAFLTAGLDLYLLPYGVIATGYECGIIEVIPNSKSRAQLGELTDGGLAEVFAREHGPPGTERHEAARQNFIRSCAGYAVASYLLQSKDRHNGNIMLDGDGHLLHIDFGFILGISPGGNLGFENAAFKLSYEMTEIIDPARSKTSPSYLHFKELCIKGFLTARSSAESIVATVAMMASSHLPCFRGPKTAVELRHRFRLDLGEKEAAAHMDGLVEAAYGRWTTGFYDWIQYLQNNIPK
ncbi:hypothetical protein APUTEX25_003453 [Auxenochlorella protothecoides]|uniref:1-phosphatidylinositol 4-kinase n=1 Tax=Auxenochlorella protothecoides TaxID=3075 RepID=A0A3M7KZW9_AUXPR|nr:hypothetical protein APUTEX25_003453 [Auxenochlorella protothecoides]|eukprot:RMZ55315.1 hypothetical protein APUTEX25_003453 [Auxenochlorella protothecoides]